MTQMTSDQQKDPSPTGMARLRDAIIAVALLALGVALVAIYQIEAGKTEPVTLTKSGGAASQMLGQGGAAGEASGGGEVVLPDAPLDRWVIGPHSETYVVSNENTNDTCNQCHDPINYVPSMEDMPASCTVCKFTVEPPPPLIGPENAHQVDCKVCHRMDKSGDVMPEVQWLEVAAIEQYAEVSSTTELCQYCHTGAGVEGHADIHVTGAHEALDCTDCHDSHAMTASCTGSGCHETLEETPGHVDHPSVHCVACHDTSGMEVRQDEARGGQWVTFAGEGDGAFPHLSHEIGREVDCARCHVEVLPGKFK